MVECAATGGWLEMRQCTEGAGLLQDEKRYPEVRTERARQVVIDDARLRQRGRSGKTKVHTGQGSQFLGAVPGLTNVTARDPASKSGCLAEWKALGR